MENSFHALLMRSQHLLQKRLYADLAETGLTPGQPKVLEYLYLHDGSTQKDIAAGCQIDPATVTSLLLRMEEAQLILRCTENGNRRSLHAYLTDRGRDWAIWVKREFEQLEQQAFSGVSDEEKSLFLQVFSQIYHNLLNSGDTSFSSN